MLRTAPLFAALLVGSLPSLAFAQVEVELHDRTSGGALPVHWSEGRRWVVGEPRHEYGIRLRNRSGGRVLAVVSVDGVNVVSGETAAPSQTGYVLEPWQEATITGWRKSLDRVAAFYFTSLPDAYAARTGRPGDVGVIGVAVFRERSPAVDLAGPAEPLAEAAPARPEAPASPASPAGGSATASSSAADSSDTAGAGNAKSSEQVQRRSRAVADAAAPAERLGTGHGRRLDSRVTYAAFERASDTPASVLAFHYDSRRNLVALGVLPPERYARRLPVPFLGAFVPDPR